MKTLILGLTAGALLADAPNYQTIRQVPGLHPITIEKFEDGPNTCYLAHGQLHSYSFGDTVSISCVKR